jgi:hypothetical protein
MCSGGVVRGWIGHTLQELSLFAARLATSETHLTISMFSCPHSIGDQPRPNNVFSIKTPSDARLSSALSAMLGTLKDIILYCPNPHVSRITAWECRLAQTP